MQINHINCNCYTARNSIGSDQHKSVKLNIFRNFLCWAFTYCTWCRASLSNPTSSSDILQTCQFQNLLRHPERFLQNKNMTILTFKKIVGKIGPQIGNAWSNVFDLDPDNLKLTFSNFAVVSSISSWTRSARVKNRSLKYLIVTVVFIVTWFLHFRVHFFSKRKGNKKDCHLQQDSIKLAFIIQNAKSSLGFHN